MSGVILERRIIIGLIVSDEYAKRIKPIWRDDLLESPQMQRITRWLLEHHEKYGKPPGHDTEQLYLTALNKGEMGKAEALLIEGILTSISDSYGDGGAEQFNAEFLYDQTVEFFQKLALTRHGERISDLTERGRIEEAEAVALTFKPIVIEAEESLAAITPRPVNWLWPDRIPLGKLTLLAGAPDQGKSTVLCDIAARVSSGTNWPDGARARRRAVLIATAEDDFDDTIIPRLMAAGADLTFCHAIGAEAANIDALCSDIDRKAESLRARGQIVGLAVIDPLASYLGKTDSHNDSAVRVALRPLRDVASRHRIAIAALRHTRKAGSGSAMDQVSGSLAFVAASRAAFLITPDRDKTRRLFLPLKGNLTPTKTGLAYHIVPADVSLRSRHGTVSTSVPRIEWLDEVVSMSADEAMEAARERPTKIEDAEEWLAGLLADGPVSMRAVEEAARRDGYSWATVRRAAEAVGVKKDKTTFNGSWSWSMPTRH
jgi:hypothetical protein